MILKNMGFVLISLCLINLTSAGYNDLGLASNYKIRKLAVDNYVEQNMVQVQPNVFEITINKKTGLSKNYKWNSVMCSNNSNGLKYQNEDNNGGFTYATWINLPYQKISNFGLPATWCSETNNYGYVLFSSGSEKQLPKKYRINLTNDAWFYAGSGTEITQLEKENKIIYDFAFGQTNITLLKNNNIEEDIYVFYNQSDGKYDFGANDYSNELKDYTYILNSTKELNLYESPYENNTLTFPVFYNYKQVEQWKEARQEYSFSGICDKDYSNCSWTLKNNSAIIKFRSYGNINTKSIINQTGCGTISASNNEYYLNTPITSSTTCLTISGNNNTLNCRNFTNSITYGSSTSTTYYYGLYVTGDGNRIINCNVSRLTTARTQRYSIYNPAGGDYNNYTNIHAFNGAYPYYILGNNYGRFENITGFGGTYTFLTSGNNQTITKANVTVLIVLSGKGNNISHIISRTELRTAGSPYNNYFYNISSPSFALGDSINNTFVLLRNPNGSAIQMTFEKFNSPYLNYGNKIYDTDFKGGKFYHYPATAFGHQSYQVLINVTNANEKFYGCSPNTETHGEIYRVWYNNMYVNDTVGFPLENVLTSTTYELIGLRLIADNNFAIKSNWVNTTDVDVGGGALVFYDTDASGTVTQANATHYTNLNLSSGDKIKLNITYVDTYLIGLNVSICGNKLTFVAGTSFVTSNISTLICTNSDNLTFSVDGYPTDEAYAQVNFVQVNKYSNITTEVYTNELGLSKLETVDYVNQYYHKTNPVSCDNQVGGIIFNGTNYYYAYNQTYSNKTNITNNINTYFTLPADNSIPLIEFVYPTNESGDLYNGTINYNATSEDSYLGIKNMSIAIYNETNLYEIRFSNLNIIQGSFVMGIGNYTINATVWDYGRNQNKTSRAYQILPCWFYLNNRYEIPPTCRLTTSPIGVLN